jgi:TonB family protein
MTSLSHNEPQPMRSPWSFMGSICLHAWVLAWVALGPVLPPPVKSLYEREIEPNENHIFWYKLSDRLPNVTPPEAKRDARPLRARARFDQNMVAGPRDTARPPQLIWAPAPEIAPAKPLPLPNIVAIAPQRPPPRPFFAPPMPKPAPARTPALPGAPTIATAAPELKAPALDLRARAIRRFTPPKQPKLPLPDRTPTLPGAPTIATAAPEVKAPALDLQARAIRRFTPPKQPKLPLPDRTPTLPGAPTIATAAPEVKAPVLDLTARAIRRFTPRQQPEAPVPANSPPLPAAPQLASPAANLTAAVTLPRQERQFVPPPPQPAAPAPADFATIDTPPPVLAATAALPAENSLAIAGLNPAKSMEVPPPPGSVKAGFSGGPKAQPKGGEGTPSGALLEIPSLTIQGGASNPQPPVLMARVSPTSPEGLAAALRAAHGAAPAGGGSTRQAVRVSGVPDPRMYGRQVYTMAIQIPDLTTYSGSWLVWFASREPDIGNPNVDMRPPLPLNMVSPKYVNSAAEDRVEGKVRLWAVIARDGHVGGISLLQHLDDRLDRSAEEALGKWRFQPAVRNGVPVDVDAVFEIPFNLAPRAAR